MAAKILPKLAWIIVLMIFAGCSSKKFELFHERHKLLNLQDGVSAEEAVLIGQKELLEQSRQYFYLFDEPAFLRDLKLVKQKDDYWFVYFKEKSKSSIPSVYLVAINRLTGEIVYSNDYNLDKEWILEAVFLKLREP